MVDTRGVVTVTYDELDRIFYKRINDELIRLGLIPDKTLYTTAADYKAAKEALALTGVIVTEVFGPGSADARDEKTYNKIVINRGVKKPGSWASNDVHFFEHTGSVYDKKEYPDFNYNQDYDIRVITRSTKYDRILSDLMDNLLPGRRYVSTVASNNTETGKLVLSRYKTDFMIASRDFVERSYQYCIEDVWLARPVTVKEDIPELVTIHATVINSNDNTILLDTDLVPL